MRNRCIAEISILYHSPEREREQQVVVVPPLNKFIGIRL